MKLNLDIENKNKMIMNIIIALVCVVLFAIMFMQFKTIEGTDITAIENMRETELRAAISEWKGKYEETTKQLDDNKKSISEYIEKIEKNEEASELVDEDLKESDKLLGRTDVYGEGIIVTVDDGETKVEYFDLIDLINELRYAGAEAISVNEVRVLASTCIAQPQGADGFTLIDSQRIVAPYVIKAIGNQTYLSSNLSLKDSGYIDRYRASGKTVELQTSKNVKILKYTKDMSIKYMKEGEIKQ